MIKLVQKAKNELKMRVDQRDYIWLEAWKVAAREFLSLEEKRIALDYADAVLASYDDEQERKYEKTKKKAKKLSKEKVNLSDRSWEKLYEKTRND